MKISKYLCFLMFFGMSLAGCDQNKVNVDSLNEIYSVYQTNGGTLSYEEWLNSIKGEKGETGEQGPKGDTGETGAKGVDGCTPYIGENGNWWIGNEDTGYQAVGQNGSNGTNGTNGADGVSITGITLLSSTGNQDTYQITFSNNNTFEFTVTNGTNGTNGADGINGSNGQDGKTPHIGDNGNWWIGDQDTGLQAIGHDGNDGSNGSNGADGVSITGITKIDTIGNVDTYRITFSNGSHFDYTVVNGTNGAQGPQGEQGIQGETGPQGPAGENGSDGVSVVSIEKTGSDGLVDTYTITLSDNTTTTFTVTNGENGQAGQQGPQGVQGPQGETGAAGQDGSNGVSVSSAIIDENGDLIVTLSDNTVVNAGHIKDTDKFTVTFHLGNKVVSTKQVAKGDTVSRPTAEETDGYDVTDWYYIDGGNHESWKFFAYVVTENIDLYAEYEPKSYTISFVDNEHHQSTENRQVVYKQQYLLPTLSCQGYTFAGWKDSNNNIWNQSGTYNLTNNVTLFATWQPNGYTVTLDPNGGELGETSLQVYYGSDYELPIPTKTDFVFAGWYDGSTQIQNSGVWSYASNKTFVARWAEYDPNLYLLDLDGGRCSVESVSIKNGSEYSLPIPTKSGNFFNGWYLDNNFVPSNGVWTSSNEPGTLVAHWVPTSVFSLSLKSDNTYSITDCDSSVSGNLIIPNKFNGLLINELEENSFANLNQLTSVILPDSIISIDNYAFYNCPKLVSVNISESVTSIGNSAFEKCSLLDTMIVPDSVTSIGSNAFVNCSSLTSVTIGKNVEQIAKGTFAGCSKLDSITLPYVGGNSTSSTSSSVNLFGYIFGDSSYSGSTATKQNYSNGVSTADVTYYIPSSLREVTITGGKLYYGAFYNCSKLISITINSNVSEMAPDVFSGCSSLTSLSLPFVGISSYSSSASSSTLFGYLFGSFSYTGGVKTTQYYSSSASTTYYIPSSLKEVTITRGRLYYGAFYNCKNLVSVTIGDQVSQLAYAIFSGCSKLTSLSLPFIGTSSNSSTASTSTLFGYLFGSASYTDGVSTSQYYNSSNYGTYYVPSSLKEVKISRGNILYGAFMNCYNLTSITFGSSISSIGEFAFRNCLSLTSYTVPQTITSIGLGAFNGCKNLTSLTIPFVGSSATELSPSESTLFGYIFGNYSYTGGVWTQQYYSGSSSGTSCYIPASLEQVTVTGGNLFYGAFYNCSNIRSITLGDNVTSIDDYAFYNCSKLCSINISKTVNSIGNMVFNKCQNLSDISIAGENESYESIDGVLFNKNMTELIFCSPTKVGEYDIPDSVTSIDNGAFSNCSKLTSISIPDGVTSIGDDAFLNCTKLTSISIPDSVVSLGNNVFRECRSLDSVTIGNNVTSIGDYAFYNCYTLTSISIPDSATSIGDYAFYGCSKLNSVTIGNNITTIGDHAFSYLRLLSSINIPNSVTTIGDCAFCSCSSLTTIDIPDSVTDIGSQAFSSCSGINSLTIGNNVTTIRQLAFSDCKNLTSIFIPKSITYLDNSAFSGCSNLISIDVDEQNEKYTSIDGVLFNKSITELLFYPPHKCGHYTIPTSVKDIGGNAFGNCNSISSITIPVSVTEFSYGSFNNCSSLEIVFYEGDVTAWNSIYNYNNISTEKVYYYSELEPTDAGNYWHYVNGEPTLW